MTLLRPLEALQIFSFKEKSKGPMAPEQKAIERPQPANLEEVKNKSFGSKNLFKWEVLKRLYVCYC